MQLAPQYMGPYSHGMACRHPADVGTVTNMDCSCEYNE